MSRKKSTIDDLFSGRLKILIDGELKVSQAYFSNKIGISASYLSAVLKNKRGPSAELVAGLYVHYRGYLQWLLTGEGEMFIDTSDQSVPASLEIEVLTKVVKGVEEYLEEAEKELEPDIKARLISLLYERFAKTGEEPDQKTVVSYLKLVA